MKFIKYISLILILALAFVACEDDKDLVQIDDASFVGPVISGIAADEAFILTKDTTSVEELKEEWVTLTWTEADYGQTLATTYVIQIDKVGNNFANAFEFNAGSDTELSILVEEVNSKMYNMEENYYPPLVQANVEIRIKADVSEFVNTVYSDAVAFYLTPYDAGKPKLYVTGTHQLIPWDFASAPTLYSLNEDESYEGYIYLTACEYLLNKTPDNYWGAGASAGTLAINGTYLTNSTEGMYWVTVDTIAETITTQVQNWGIIGSATPTSWDSDTDMEFDLELNKYKITMDLIVGHIKFRANDDWGTNLGDDDTDGSMEFGGSDIPINEAGNYTVYLDLSNPEKFSYEIVKN